jgi:hypothetical protein
MSETLIENSKSDLGCRPCVITIKTKPRIITLIGVETKTELLLGNG